MSDHDPHPDWEAVGRDLFARLLDECHADLDDALGRTAQRIHAGHDLDAADVQRLRTAADDLHEIAEQAARICPDTEPFPDWHEVLDDEAVNEYAERVQADH